MHFRYHAEREKKSACNIRSLRSIEYPFHFLLINLKFGTRTKNRGIVIDEYVIIIALLFHSPQSAPHPPTPIQFLSHICATINFVKVRELFIQRLSKRIS